VVEYQLPKLRVAGSSPVARSIHFSGHMSHSHQSTLAGAVVALSLTLIGLSSCSSGGPGHSRSELDRAIEFYIAGDYDEAVERLDKLSKTTESEERLREIYLYLGRSFVELEQYSQAIDAFTAGAAYGGGLIFEEYLTRLGVVVSVAPKILAASDKITRAQLAALIDKMFFGVKDIGAPSDEGRQDVSVGPSTSVQRGVVPTLPDGEFHGNDFVTRAAFYVVVARLIEDTGIPGGPTSFFDGGFSWVLSPSGGTTDVGRIDYISGREALDTLQRLAEVRRTNG
jgi:hypothetical protein